MNCRHCGTPLELTVLDLGSAPPSNAYLAADDLSCPEVHYPLKIKVCDRCWLVQTEDCARADELFVPDYSYFSSTSAGWLEHASLYAERMRGELGLDDASLVIEIGSNDGYLLRNFRAAGIPCLGIEPTEKTADAAEMLGIPVLREFFGEAVGKRLADRGEQADLIVGNNVFAHVPDINDFARGLCAMLKPSGTITLEFPHLKRLIQDALFDTVYHEHYSYLSLFTTVRVLETAGLRIWHVEELPTHGGSLRVFGCHETDSRRASAAVSGMLEEERNQGLQTVAAFQAFQARADRIKNDLLMFLIEQKRAGRSVAAYGAAAKGNTLLNYAGIRVDLLPYVCDAAAAKQGKFLPGSRIPILAPSTLIERAPDFVLILPWNIADEVRKQNVALEERGTRFVTAVPKLEIL